MTSWAISDVAAEWIKDVLEEETRISGEQFRYSLSMGLMPTPKGDAVIWALLVTLPAPLLGGHDLAVTTKFQGSAPSESWVRKSVKDSVVLLRNAFRKTMAEATGQSNGSALPPGLRGMKL
jgi:hypothetical protein